MIRGVLRGEPRDRSAASRALVLAASLFALALALVVPRHARAHSTTFAVYSKYEATTSGRSVAFVFAFDRGAVLDLLERDAAHARVEPAAIADFRAFFSRYLFDRFFVTGDGTPCVHPDQLGRFFWDPTTRRVVAVTRYTCASAPAELTVRSLVTHDMPVSHELVGDLQHGRALVRSFFYDDSVETHIALADLHEGGAASSPAAARPRGRFSYVAMPDRERRYADLAQAELGDDVPSGAPVDVNPGATLAHFLGQGILHILTGYDHVLFIVTLMLAVGSWRQLAVIVTSFTAAHSVTLVLATLGAVHVPSRVVEPLIALSVLVVAVDAVLRPRASPRALVTFGFGLVHGFGLSNVLTGLGLSGRDLVPALVGFNGGVEVGQLLVVTPLFPLVLLLRKRETAYGRARGVICASVGALALVWIVLRAKEAFTG